MARKYGKVMLDTCQVWMAMNWHQGGARRGYTKKDARWNGGTVGRCAAIGGGREGERHDSDGHH
jgi:hypothetical protein